MIKAVEKITSISFIILVVCILIGAGSKGPIEDRTTGLIVGGIVGVSLLVSLVGMIFLGAKNQ